MQVGTATDWTSLTAGWSHTCGLKTDGTAWCWGSGGEGQLGNGGSMYRLTPFRLEGL